MFSWPLSLVKLTARPRLGSWLAQKAAGACSRVQKAKKIGTPPLQTKPPVTGHGEANPVEVTRAARGSLTWTRFRPRPPPRARTRPSSDTRRRQHGEESAQRRGGSARASHRRRRKLHVTVTQ